MMYELHDVLIRCNVHGIYKYKVGPLPQSIQQTREVGLVNIHAQITYSIFFNKITVSSIY